MRLPFWSAIGSLVAAGLMGLIQVSAPSIEAPRVGLILHDNVLLHTRASQNSTVVTALVQQTQVEVLSQGGPWDHVRVWTSVSGWVPKREVAFRKPWITVSTYQAPEVHYHLQAHKPQAVHADARTVTSTALAPRPGASPRSVVGPGTNVVVTSWQQDSFGSIWYKIGAMWARGDTIQFQPRPRSTGTPSQCTCRLVFGKGMWLTLGTVTDSSAVALVHAASRTGMTHIYVEAAISPLGFHGRRSMAHLLAAAHRSHLSVVAWVYPYLFDVAADIVLTRTVATFRTPSGDKFDGIATDLERNMTLPNIRAYSQLVRAYVGSNYLLVGVTYPPQSLPTFPFSEVARTYDVIAPMDYWHQTKSGYGLDYGHMMYGFDYGYRYAEESIQSIRRSAGNVPVEPIGQTFDNYGRFEMGPHAPSPQEIHGFLAGSAAAGAVGASFFQWMTATVPEWRQIRDFHF